MKHSQRASVLFPALALVLSLSVVLAACSEDGSDADVEGMCNDGGTLRAPEPPGPGDLVITEVMANPSVVSDNDGEWFEVLVTAAVDLIGLQLSTTSGGEATLRHTLDGGDCFPVNGGTRVLFARKADAASNGGLPPVDHVFSFGLNNSSFGLVVGVDDEVLDGMTWSVVPNGASLSLDPGSTDPVANDEASAWCAATSTYGEGVPADRGTPGAVNDAC